ncbi:MAG: NUDIX hydrolase [Blastocatellia bacterium]
MLVPKIRQIRQIRLIALCICRREDRILVMEGRDSVKGQMFYRPLGGGIEFGELGAEAVAREFLEEVNAVLNDVRYLFTIENIFVHEGKPNHELALMYDGLLADETLYARPLIEGLEANGEPIKAVWKSLHEFDDGHPPLYPSGLRCKLIGNGPYNEYELKG